MAALLLFPGLSVQSFYHDKQQPSVRASDGSIPVDTPLRFERLSLEAGLSQGAVLAIYQDRLGYLWVGTQDGLNRYDGYTFTVFKNDPDDDNSLSSSTVLCILEDSQGFLWFGTWGSGLNRYDRKTGNFNRYQHDSANPGSLSNDLVAALFEDSSGRLWVGTMGGGLDLYDPESTSFIHHTHEPSSRDSISSNYISAITEDPSGNLWLGTGGFGTPGSGVNRFDPRTQKAEALQHDLDNPHSLSSNTISSLAWDFSGMLWVGTGGYGLHGDGVNRINPTNGDITRFVHDPKLDNGISSNNIFSLMIDTSGILWIGAWGAGIDRLDPLNPDLDFYNTRNDPFVPTSLSADMVWSFFEDRSGVVWVGTVNGGLNKINPQVQRFRLYRNHPNKPESLGFDVVSTIVVDSAGKYWIGTLGGGLDYYDPQSEVFTHFTHKALDPKSIPGNTVTALAITQESDLWIGTHSGLALLSPESSSFLSLQHDPADNDSLVDNVINSLAVDLENNIWIGTLNGLDRLDHRTEKFSHIYIPGADSITSLLIDRRGILWAGTRDQGIFHIIPEMLSINQVQYTQYKYDSEKRDSLSDNSVWTIFEDSTGILWIGTSRGLNRFIPETQTFIRYTEADGLANNSVLCIQEDSTKHLWISTNDGLSRLDPQSITFKNFDSSDGLQSDEFNSGSCAQSPSGEMIFGGINGVSLFSPDQIRDNPVPPPVVLSNFWVFDEPYSVDLNNDSPIKLTYRSNFIAFEFVALDFHAPHKNQYAYMMEGFDDTWISAGNRRYASYTNLDGGNYIFRVRASNNDGIWNKDDLEVPIQITPPLWRNWWFQLAVGFAFVALVAAGIRLRLEGVSQQNRLLENLVHQRTAELQEMNNQLELEIVQRKLAEESLAKRASEELASQEAAYRRTLEQRIEERTQELNAANELLQKQAAQEAVVNERTRLARELHDAVTQTLFSASLIAEVLPELWRMDIAEGEKSTQELRQLTRGALAEMRTLLLELRPAVLTQTRFDDLLRQLTEALMGRSRIQIELVMNGQSRLPPEVQLALYRITQEALNNVLKHARASYVRVEVNMSPGGVHLSVSDNGKGFDTEQFKPDSLGLRIMQERADSIQAELEIMSNPGQGTQVTVIWTSSNYEQEAA